MVPKETLFQGKTNQTDAACSNKEGALFQCAPLAIPYVPFQQKDALTYHQTEALQNGTLFPGLNLPFHRGMEPGVLPNTALAELMALEFALVELGLYLDTHAEDAEAFELYQKYAALEKEGRKKYTETYGPLVQSDVAQAATYTWVRDPWPWELPEGRAK